MPNFQELELKLALSFTDPKILKQAFTHKSFVNEKGNSIDSNERLEFLGDAVLELASTKFLYDKYPSLPEGELTALRSSLVRGRNLAQVAINLNLGEYLFLSKGEEVSGGRSKNYILANTVEALIGAIYVDLGYQPAENFILTHILANVEEIIEQGLHIDSKTKFQENAQEHLNTTPEYRVISENGPDHNKTFEMGVYVNDELIATGKGSSKQKAEQEAAKEALEQKGW